MKYVFLILSLFYWNLAFGENCKTFPELEPFIYEIKSEIENSKSCSTNSDCEIVHLDCPFGCGIALSKGAVNNIKGLTNQFFAQLCGDPCVYKQCWPIIGVECKNNQCQKIYNPDYVRPN